MTTPTGIKMVHYGTCQQHLFTLTRGTPKKGAVPAIADCVMPDGSPLADQNCGFSLVCPKCQTSVWRITEYEPLGGWR